MSQTLFAPRPSGARGWCAVVLFGVLCMWGGEANAQDAPPPPVRWVRWSPPTRDPTAVPPPVTPFAPVRPAAAEPEPVLYLPNPSVPPPAQAPPENRGSGGKILVDPTELDKLIETRLKEYEQKWAREAEDKKKEEDRKKHEDEERKKAEDEIKKQEEEVQKKRKEAEGYEVGTILDMKPVWRNGLWLETPNKDFQIHLGGVVHYDATWFGVPERVEFGTNGTGPFDDGFNPRRLRLRTDGTMWEVVDFRFELEFANGFTNAAIPASNNVFLTPGPTDVFVTLTKLPLVGNVRIGNQKEPFSLEHLNSLRFMEFLERSLLYDLFAPSPFTNGYNPGVQLFNTYAQDSGTWAVGVFKNERNQFGFGLGDGFYDVTGRLTYLPWYEDEGKYLVHLGAAYSHQNPIGDRIRFRVRDSIRNAPAPLLPIIADTGFIRTGNHELIGLELASVLGPLTIQAEYQATVMDNASRPDGDVLGTVFYHGFYIQAMFFLTGEHRPYNRQLGRFDRVIPREPFYFVGGPCGPIWGKGAWEVGARYTWLDLSHSGLTGAVLNDLTLGVNWYLNPNVKLQCNYDMTYRSEVGGNSDGAIHGFGLRMAFDY